MGRRQADRSGAARSAGVQAALPLRAFSQPRAALDLRGSLTRLTRDLVQVRSQGGVDSQQAVVERLSDWFAESGVPCEVLKAPKRLERNAYMGVLAEIGTGRPPFYLLTGCLDTAPFGAPGDWTHSPTSGLLDKDGWLHGRGSGDSKAAIAVFSHLMRDLRGASLSGTLVFLADSDEHTGRFGAVKEVVERRYKGRLAGAYIGYPGNDVIKIGARGFHRAVIRFYGEAGHSGARAAQPDNAIRKATRFADLLFETPLPRDEASSFAFGPKCSIVHIAGGASGFSMVPDRCTVRVDVRLTPTFQKEDARRHLAGLVARVAESHGGRRTAIDPRGSWPAYEINRQSALLKALRAGAAAAFGRLPALDVAAPSNVGNYLAAQGVEATCGFGVSCIGIHAPDERIDSATLSPVYEAYRAAAAALVG